MSLVHCVEQGGRGQSRMVSRIRLLSVKPRITPRHPTYPDVCYA
jgi:hypothetical protein